MTSSTSSSPCRLLASVALILLAQLFSSTTAFAPVKSAVCHNLRQSIFLHATPDENNNLGVIDLTDDDDDDNSVMVSTEGSASSEETSTAAPFLSQGELSDDPNLLNPDFTDPKKLG